jgi:hypothetical protein
VKKEKRSNQSINQSIKKIFLKLFNDEKKIFFLKSLTSIQIAWDRQAQKATSPICTFNSAVQRNEFHGSIALLAVSSSLTHWGVATAAGLTGVEFSGDQDRCCFDELGAQFGDVCWCMTGHVVGRREAPVAIEKKKSMSTDRK